MSTSTLGNMNPVKKIVTLRKGIAVAIAIVLIVVIVTIMLNLSYTMRMMREKNKNREPNPAFATTIDTNWYQNEKIAQPVQKQIVASVTKSLIKPELISIQKVEPGNTFSESEPENKNELLRAMAAPLTSNQLTNDKISSFNEGYSPDLPTQNHQEMSQNQDDQNKQVEKKAFLNQQGPKEDDYLHSFVQAPRSKFMLQAGTNIPGSLITGIDSDLPGQITGQVESNVYDSVSGNYLLIPQGARLQGTYDSTVVYGQQRLLVVWKRILFPNGESISLEGMPGVDLNGYAGFFDEVNHHYVKIFSSVLLLSALGAGAQLSQPQNQNNNFNAAPTIGQTLAQSLGINLATLGTTLTEKNLNIQPNLKIRPGYEFSISVTKDILFARQYNQR
jgi:type IV secretory pathway VirB10-like protein